MSNKIVSIALSVVFAMQGICFAEEMPEIKLGKNTYTETGVIISGSIIPAKERTLTFRVMLPGKETDDLSGIYRMNELKSDADGKFNIEVIPQDSDPSGEYAFFVGGREYTAADGKYSFYSSAEKKQFIDKLNQTGNTEEISGLISESTGILLSFGCDLDKYNLLQEKYKDNIFDYLAKNSNFEKSVFADSFNKMTGLQFFNGLSEIADSQMYYQTFETNAGLLGISTGEKSNAGILGKENLIRILQSLFAGGKTYDTPDELIKAYNEATAVEVFNSVLWSGMENALEINAGYLGISLDYGAYASEKESVYHALAKHKYTSSAEIINVFNEAKMNLGRKSDSGNSGSSGGSGGSGSSGGNKSNNMSIPVAKTDIESLQSVSKIKDIELVLWAKEAIAALEKKNIVSGDENGNFNPNNNITREQFAHMLTLAFDFADSDLPTAFIDVDEDAWYKKSVMAAYNAGIVSGIGDNVFGTGIKITRQDMSAMLYRAINKKGIKLSAEREVPEFSDSSDISEYASDGINYLYTCGIISGMGDGTFSPKENATKAQAAVMINAVLEGSEV